MRLREQRLWTAMRGALNGKALMERVENMMGDGRPDVDVLADGNFVPVELKAKEAWPKTERGAVLGADGLRLSQRNWHLRWLQWGGRSLIVVGVGEGAAREVFIFGGSDADYVNGFNTAQFRAAAIGKGWADLLALIKERQR